MFFLKLYLLSCLFVYLYFLGKNLHLYKGATKMDMLRGIIGTLIYPITLTVMYWDEISAFFKRFRW